ncbi:Peptidase S24/S26A/S26B/S26C family protein [Zostera marina]|uniref:Peptidase S24/S26A/S26B/S26C family protein n=1 Tax=Zostera marina TaxID=29655 RepID=A0A0K9NMP8_ZOSMR|nr:Peptidase S24/S26A/S26B/S26C family protein [Zostera marina]
MGSLSMWYRYLAQKVSFSVTDSLKTHRVGKIPQNEVLNAVWKNVFQGRLTYLHWYKGQEMAPIIEGEGGLLVRKLPDATPRNVFVGDVVVLKDPEKPDDYLVRRLAAIEDYEIVSTDEKDESFVLEKDQCWVVSDNDSFKPEEAKDSRAFGPLTLSNIVGRVLYSLRSPVDHGPVQNSDTAMQDDLPVLTVELDVSEILKSPKP